MPIIEIPIVTPGFSRESLMLCHTNSIRRICVHRGDREGIKSEIHFFSGRVAYSKLTPVHLKEIMHGLRHTPIPGKET